MKPVRNLQKLQERYKEYLVNFDPSSNGRNHFPFWLNLMDIMGCKTWWNVKYSREVHLLHKGIIPFNTSCTTIRAYGEPLSRFKYRAVLHYYTSIRTSRSLVDSWLRGAIISGYLYYESHLQSKVP
jgi:hypothetical protein